MYLLVTKKDFPAFVPFTDQIGDHLVTPHIQDAQLFDVRRLMRKEEYTEMEASAEQHERTEFHFLEFDPREFFTELLQTEWENKKLYTLFMGFVRPLIVCEAFRRLIPYHGAHVTGNGFEVISEMGHQPISAATRAEIREDILTKCNYYRTRLETALSTYRGTTPPTTTCTPYRRRRAGLGGSKFFNI